MGWLWTALIHRRGSRPGEAASGARIEASDALGPEATAYFKAHRTGAELANLIGESLLVGVIGVGASVTVSRIRVEFLALEVRERGARALLRFGPTELHESSSGGSSREPQVEVRDDTGTKYAVGVIVRSRFRLGGEVDVYITPTPPASASRFGLAITQFVSQPSPPFPSPSPSLPAPLPGPWTFDVSLEDG